jgi:YYY domain-containing protein
LFERFHTGSVQSLALAAWVAVVAALSALALPLTARLFAGFPFRGAPLAPALALAVVGLVGYLVGQLSLALAAAAGPLVLAGLAALALRNAPDLALPDPRRLAAPAAVVGVAFAGMLALRAVDPAAHAAGGEKFLDFTLLRSLLRAEALPLGDPWFAGEPARYYYGGHLLAATLARLAGVPAALAYNLALATVFAAMVGAAWGVAGALAPEQRRTAATLGALLVGVAGTLATPVRVVLGYLPRDVAAAVGHAALDGIRAPYSVVLEESTGLFGFNYWEARYVVPDAVTLFPGWAFLNGDLRPHMLGAPLFLLAVGLALAYGRTDRERLARRWGLLAVLGALAGLYAVVNTWSVPAVLGLTGLALALGPAHPVTLLGLDPPDGLAGELLRPAAAAAALAPVVVLAAAVASPHLLVGTATNRGVGLFPPGSPPGPFLLAYGGFLLPFVAWLAGGLRGRGDRRLLAAAVAGLAVLALVDPVVAVLVALAGGGWWLARARESLLPGLVVAGAVLLLVGELAYARVYPFDPNAPRWNTVYKLSTQAWLIWGVAGGAVLARLLAAARGAAPGGLVDARTRSLLGRAAVVVVVALACTFGVLGSVAHVGTAAGGGGIESLEDTGNLDFQAIEPTLDATRFVDRYHGGEAPAIDWLDDREGRPVLVTAPGEPVYQWRSAPSVFTGLPTVVGWEHEVGYHGRDAYDRRVAAVGTVYEGPWPAAAELLREHEVRYVYVGPVERERYDVREFAAHEGVSVAFRAPDATVYRVDRDRLETG